MYNLIKLFILLIISSFALAEPQKYTDREQIALKKFREILSNDFTDDYQKVDGELIPWLRTTNLDIRAATERFRTYLKWRKDNRIDTIGNESLITDFNPPPYSIDGFDKEGRPLMIFSPANIDLRRLALQGQRDKLIRIFWQMMELGAVHRRAASEKFGKEITRVVSILDITGYNLRQHFCLACISIFREWFTDLELYYPQRIKEFVIINVPRIAIPLMEALRPVLSEDTSKAVNIFSPDRKEWSTFLLNIIEPDQLPYRFGGTKKSNTSTKKA